MTDPPPSPPGGPFGPGRGSPVVVVAPPGAGGIRRAAEDTAAALSSLGVPATVAARPGPSPAHFHYGNASRSVLRDLAIRRGDLVTLHDVVPRNGVLRRLLPRAAGLVLARHHLVVHSRHAAELLAPSLPSARPEVVPLLIGADTDPGPPPFEPDDGRVTAVVAGRLRAVKGVAELVAAAGERPGLRLILVGRAGDAATERLLDRLPGNVAHVDRPDDRAFFAALAAADVVVSWRTDSVGETSGPVVQAHIYGTPVAGLGVGSLPEYSGPGDVVVPAGTPAAALLDAVLHAPLGRIPAGDGRRAGPREVAARYVELYRRFGLIR